MKKNISIVGSSLLVGLLMLVVFAATVISHGIAYQKDLLRNSPLSTGVLIVQAIRHGTVHLMNGQVPDGNVIPDLTCKPTPCVLPDKRVSKGSKPVSTTSIAVNPKNAKQLLIGGGDYNCPYILGFYSSSDGGNTWTTHCMDKYAAGLGVGDPTVGYDLNGNSYIGGIVRSNPGGSNIIFEKSSDNGKIWSTPAVAMTSYFSGGLIDKDWMQIDTNASSPYTNYIYFSATQFASSMRNAAISVSHSYDGGTTWKTVQVDKVQFFPNIDQFSDLAVAKDGTVYVSWMRCTAQAHKSGNKECAGTIASEVISKSIDGGNTWSNPVTIAKVNLTPDKCGCGAFFFGKIPKIREYATNIPAIGIDNGNGSHHGDLYATFYNWTGSQMQVEISTSTNGGSSWGIPRRVTTARNDEFNPWLSVSDTGVVAVTWSDRRNDPNNIDYELYGALSSGRDNSLGPDYQISSNPSHCDHSGCGGTPINDHTGNIWDGKTLYAVWMDTRTGTGQAFIGGIKNNL